MKKLKKLKMLLIATGMMASLSFLNCYAVPQGTTKGKDYKESHQEKDPAKRDNVVSNFQQNVQEEEQEIELNGVNELQLAEIIGD